MRGTSNILPATESYCPESLDEGNMVLLRAIYLMFPEKKEPVNVVVIIQIRHLEQNHEDAWIYFTLYKYGSLASCLY